MTIKDMHYDFKKKLNKVDSQQYRNLLIPEIDWALNEAQNVFIDIVSEPRLRTQLGFEKSQKNIDDIRTLVIPDLCSTISNTGTIPEYNILTLPENYRYFIKGDVYITKGSCNKKVRITPQEHDDEFEEDVFYKSSFEWKRVNALFVNTGLKIFSDGTFTHDRVCISYIKNPIYIHNAEDYRNGTYNLPGGQSLIGSVSCELPIHTHREIVDLAVMIISGELQIPDYQIKYAKLNLNNLKQ